MLTGILMIVLTALDGGGFAAAFVNTASLAECEARAATVRTILEKGGPPIEQLVCRASPAKFEPFSHATDEDAERFAYRIVLGAETATVEPVGSCDGDFAVGSYCATSNQKMLPSEQ